MKELPLNLKQGDIVVIDGLEFIFERIDPDGLITFQSIGKRVDFVVADPLTGFPRKPNADEIARLMANGNFFKRAKDLEEGPRKAARKRELDAKAARAVDPVSEFRTAFTRSRDKVPCSLSDAALQERNAQLLLDPVIAAMPGAKMYAGSTLREWVKKRGHHGDRRARDGVAMPGGRRGRQVGHPKEILQHYLAQATGRKTTSSPNAKAKAYKSWIDYKGEINRINRGLPTGRKDAEYLQPAKPYSAVSYTTFWRMCRDLESSATLLAEHGRQAVYQRFGGGGRYDRHHRIGAFAHMDDTPVPAIFLVDEDLKLPLGQATFTALMEDVSSAILGWHLGWDAASSSTALETYAHANTAKAIPSDIDELHPELKWICGKVGAILLDNLSGHHSRHFEDSMLDVGTDVHFAGAGMPRDKAKMERVIGTILGLAFKDLPSATYDIPRAREFGFDPTKMAMISIQKARELLLRAICVYHLSPNKGLDGRSPALVFAQHAAQSGIAVIDDLDEFRRSIGNVEYDCQLRPSGVVVNGNRYSDAKITRTLIDDLVSLQPPSEAKRTKQITLIVKVKYSEHDLGRIEVWNERTKRYTTLPAVNLDYADGMPLWAHKRVAKIANLDMQDYAQEDEATSGQRLIEIRKRLFEEIRNITPEAAEHDRATLAKLKDSPLFKRVMGDIVEVVDEDLSDLVQPVSDDAPTHQIADEMAAKHRDDTTVPTPRPRRQVGRSSAQTGAASASKKRDQRDAGKPKSASSETPRVATKSTANLKWGTQYD